MVGFLAHKPFFIVHLGEAREPLEFGSLAAKGIPNSICAEASWKRRDLGIR